MKKIIKLNETLTEARLKKIDHQSIVQNLINRNDESSRLILDNKRYAMDIRSEKKDFFISGRGSDMSVIDGGIHITDNDVKVSNIHITGNLIFNHNQELKVEDTSIDNTLSIRNIDKFALVNNTIDTLSLSGIHKKGLVSGCHIGKLILSKDISRLVFIDCIVDEVITSGENEQILMKGCQIGKGVFSNIDIIELKDVTIFSELTIDSIHKLFTMKDSSIPGDLVIKKIKNTVCENIVVSGNLFVDDCEFISIDECTHIELFEVKNTFTIVMSSLNITKLNIEDTNTVILNECEVLEKLNIDGSEEVIPCLCSFKEVVTIENSVDVTISESTLDKDLNIKNIKKDLTINESVVKGNLRCSMVFHKMVIQGSDITRFLFTVINDLYMGEVNLYSPCIIIRITGAPDIPGGLAHDMKGVKKARFKKVRSRVPGVICYVGSSPPNASGADNLMFPLPPF